VPPPSNKQINKYDAKEAIEPESEADLRLAVQLTVCAGAFKVQLVVEDEAGAAQTGAVRVLERTVLTGTRTRRRTCQSNTLIYLNGKWIAFI